MHKTESNILPLNQEPDSQVIYRITALWALSESALGGTLHLLKVPFTGLVIGSVSVLIISLLAYLSNKRGTIIKSLIIVVVVKAVVAPYAPLNSYLALVLQGVLGEILFFSRVFYSISAFTLAVIAALMAAFQKLIVLTLLFGMNLWNAVDSFVNSVAKQFLPGHEAVINYSHLVVGIYVAFHVIGGIFAGLIAIRIPRWIKEKKEVIVHSIESESAITEKKEKKRKKRLWYRRKSGIIFLSVSFIIIIISYLIPGLSEGLGSKMLIMILRSVVITVLWFYILAPLAIKLFKKFVLKNKNRYSNEVDKIIQLLPGLKSAVNEAYNNSSEFKGIKRIKEFISSVLAYIVLSE